MRQPFSAPLVNENKKQKLYLFIEIVALVFGVLEVAYIISGIGFDYYYPFHLYELLQWVFFMALSISPLALAFAQFVRDIRKKTTPRKTLIFVALSTSPFIIYSVIYAIILFGSFYFDYGVSSG